jgi:serine kinase of HPr protein (carbohydrate metabolism regulator)
MPALLLTRGSCVALSGEGVLLRGPSGAGKSDLALRLIDGGATLVGDDYVDLSAEDGRLWAAGRAAIAGLLEIRGVGPLAFSYLPRAPLALLIDLEPPATRLPEPAAETILGIVVPRFALAPFEASAAAKIRALLRASRSGQR